MSVLVRNASENRHKARVLAVLLFLLGCVVVVTSVVLATGDVTSTPPPASAQRDLFNVPVVTVERTATAEGTAASMSFHWGTPVLLIGPPAAALAVGRVLRHHRTSLSGR